MDGAEQLFAWAFSVIVFASLAYFLHRSQRPLLSKMCAFAVVGVSLGFFIGFFLGNLHVPIRHWLYSERVGSPAARDFISDWIGRTAHFSPSIGMVSGVVVALFFAHARHRTMAGLVCGLVYQDRRMLFAALIGAVLMVFVFPFAMVLVTAVYRSPLATLQCVDYLRRLFTRRK